MASIGRPLTMSGPSQGALRAHSKARLRPTTAASPAMRSDVRTLDRNVSAPAFTIKAAPLATKVIR